MRTLIAICMSFLATNFVYGAAIENLEKVETRESLRALMPPAAQLTEALIQNNFSRGYDDMKYKPVVWQGLSWSWSHNPLAAQHGNQRMGFVAEHQPTLSYDNETKTLKTTYTINRSDIVMTAAAHHIKISQELLDTAKKTNSVYNWHPIYAFLQKPGEPEPGAPAK